MFRKSYAQVYDGDVNWASLESPAAARYFLTCCTA
jgi:hypothetical protein